MEEHLGVKLFQRAFGHYTKMLFDIKVAVVICLAPFLIFLHLLFSENSNTFHLFGLEFIHKYPDNQVFVWSLLVSLIPFIITFIIFITTRNGWRYFLLPLLVYLFISTLMIFTDHWQEYRYLLKKEGIIWTLFFLENILFYDKSVFKKYRTWKLEISKKDLWQEVIYGSYGKLNKRVIEILRSKNLTSLNLYLCKIYYILQILNQKSPNQKKEISSDCTNPSSIRSNLINGVLLVLFTGLLFTYTFVPNGVDYINIQDFKIGSFGFKTVRIFVWYTFSRISLLLLFSWCFFQCKQWWKWSMLSPIVFYTYQLFEIFIKMTMDEFQNIIILSPIFFLLIIIHIHSKSIRRQLQTLYFKELINCELEERIKEAVNFRGN